MFWLWRRNWISIIQPFVFPFSKASYFLLLTTAVGQEKKKNAWLGKKLKKMTYFISFGKIFYMDMAM